MAAAHYNPRDKLKTQEWAQTLFRADNFYVLDTETTGLDKTDEVIQIGIIDKNGKAVFDSLVKPTIAIPPESTRVHRITDEMVKDAPTFPDVYVKLSVLLAGQTLIAYNMDFDWRMLNQTIAKYGLIPLRTGTRHCAMKEYARYKGQFDLRKRSYRWHSLSEACKQQRIPLANVHSALGDVRLTLALMRKMAE